MKRILIKKILTASLALLLLCLQPGTLHALDGTLRSKVENGIPYVQTESACISGGSLVTTSREDFPASTVKKFEAHLPKIQAMREQYVAASEKYNVPWEMFAAIHYREGGNSPDRSPLAGESFGSANPDGHGTIDNMDEGLREAARLLKSLAKASYGVTIAEDGTNTFEELQKIFLSYNRGVLYKNAGVSPDRSPYVMNGFDDQHLNMSWVSPPDTVSGRDTNLGALTIFSLLTGASANCDGQLGVGEDGFTFPLKTTQSKIKNHRPAWCYRSQSNCHHTYAAADIFQPTGTPVVAARPGKVVSARDGGGRCSIGDRVTIKGAEGDGRVYYYAHMGSLKVRGGETVEAGQEIGTVGTDNDAQCTPKHLHFDILPPQYNQRIACGYGCSNPGAFINPQPALISAFNNLPQ